MKIQINSEKCISCGTCVAMMPEVFELDDEMKSKVKNPALVEKVSKEKLEEVAASCPVEAIEIAD